MTELHYGENAENFLYELSQYEYGDIGNFDVYGEDEDGKDGFANVDVTLLASDALKVIAALQAQVNELTEKLDRINDYCFGVDSERMDYIEKFNALAAENAALKKFFGYAWSIAVEAGDFDGADIQEKALELGLIERVTYEAEKHLDKVNDASLFTDGDDVYFPTENPDTDAVLREIKAQGVDEMATEFGLIYQSLKGNSIAKQAAKSAVFKCVSVAEKLRKGEVE